MIKLLTTLLLFVIATSNIYAQELKSDDPINLYNNRGVNLNYAKEASQILWKRFSDNPNNDHTKLYIGYMATEAEFFYITQTKESEIRMTLFKSLADKLEIVLNTYFPTYKNGVALSDTKLNLLMAEFIYFYAISLANYSELKHFTEALQNWPTVEKLMINLIKIKASTVQYYGAHRTLAIANMKMPAPFGDLKLAESYMKKAYTETLLSKGTSVYMFNTVTYAEILIKRGQKNSACLILSQVKDFTPMQIADLNPSYIPENLINLEKAKTLYRESQCD